MRTIILNGSPKGEKSYTLQYVRYLEKVFSQDVFEVFPIGQNIRKIVNDDKVYQEVLNHIAGADCVLWSYPIYYLMVPGQLKQFIEKVLADKNSVCFQGKYTSYLSSSAHYYDHTAHHYLQGICEDLKMNFVPGFSAATYDLLSYKQDNPLRRFWETVQMAVTNGHHYPRAFDVLGDSPGPLGNTGGKEQKKSEAARICLITDHTSESNTNLRTMINTFCERSPYAVEVVNISEQKIKGGCLGCMRCAYDGICIYKDDYLPLFKKTIQTARMIVYAGALVDRYLSADFKIYFDRNFFNGHRPIYTDKMCCFLLAGNLRKNTNLRELLIGQVETWMMENLGFITDEVESSDEFQTQLDTLFDLIQFRTEHYWKAPNTFLGVGAKKLFRDLVYEQRGIMNADYEYYRTHNLLDFPTRNFAGRFKSALLRTFFKIPSVRKNLQNKIMDNGLKPLQKKVVEADQ